MHLSRRIDVSVQQPYHRFDQTVVRRSGAAGGILRLMVGSQPRRAPDNSNTRGALVYFEMPHLKARSQ